MSLRTQRKVIQQPVKLHRIQKRTTFHLRIQTLPMSHPLRWKWQQRRMRLQSHQKMKQLQKELLMQLLRMPLWQVRLKRLQRNPANLCRKSP